MKFTTIILLLLGAPILGAQSLPPVPIPFTSDGVQRFFSGAVGKHFFTNNYSEASMLYTNYVYSNVYGLGVSGPSDWSWEQTAWQPASGQMVYRLVNGSSHFYTMSSTEAAAATQSGWSMEGNCGTLQIYNSGYPLKPIYRLWDGGSDHFYTADVTERYTGLNNGWRDEGILGYGY